jgi:hypothetical protein
VGAAAGPAATTAGPRAGWLWLARRYAGTTIGGYLLLMAVVILYYYGVVRVGGAFVESAFTGCALLIALATPVFALASWLAERRGARRAPPLAGPIRDPGRAQRVHHLPPHPRRDHRPQAWPTLVRSSFRDHDLAVVATTPKS